ncbi:MAG: glycosyltransferase [Flavobacteriaceae bacterium]|nr:glycosyltransferase [Flavobacteriaceae bacterium]
MSGKTKLALISPSKNAYSETFIKAHIDFLNSDVLHYYGGYSPRYLANKYSLITLKKRLINKIREMAFRRFDTALEYSLFNSFKKEGVQVVLAEYGPTGQKVWKVCKALGLPLIVNFHGYDSSKKTVIEEYDAYVDLFGYAFAVVAVSEVMYQKLLELGCPGDKLILNTYGPDPSFEEVVPKFTKPWFVGIGRFVDKKAPYYLLFSFKRVVDKFPDAKLIIAGNGPLLNTCKNISSHLKISQSVEFPGIVSPEEYRLLLSKSIAFVQHSITAEDGDMEGTPLAVLEASAAGLPVISTRHAGILDVIIDQKTGLLVEEHDVEGMSTAMLYVLEHPEMSKEMGIKGKMHIRTNYTMERHIGMLDSLIETALKEIKKN